MITDLETAQEIYSVSQLNREARYLLESSFPQLWVQGEISNLKRPGSGHIYFSLKDEAAQVRCAMFRMRNSLLTFEPKDGMQVLVRGRISIYEERGDYQLVLDHLEDAGTGILQRKFEELKKRLAAEGLFNNEYKKPLPKFPKSIGVVTSPTGAAIRDIIAVMKKRHAGIPIIIYPTPVQGNDAAPQIVNAIQTANLRNECDVLIVGRGGGSIEDLWPFNEEIVARAIFASEIPIISAVGHEIDFTIADFVADKRAPTPSAAAEMVCPDTQEYLQNLQQLTSRLKQFMFAELKHAQAFLLGVSKRLQHPRQKLQEQAQRLDYLEQNLIKAQSNIMAMAQQKLANVSRALNAVSPLNTLQRGYAIASKNGEVLYSVKQVNAGDVVTTQVGDGTFESQVM